MSTNRFIAPILILAACFKLLVLSACSDHADIGKKVIVENKEQLDDKAGEVIHGTIKDLLSGDTDLGDSFRIRNTNVVSYLYDASAYKPIWTTDGNFTPAADSLLAFIARGKQYGLFPEDYYQQRITNLRSQLVGDTSRAEQKLDAALWSYSDMLMTSAFVQLVRDLKVGRIQPDSIVARDSSLNMKYYQEQLGMFSKLTADSFAKRIEPTHTGYQDLRQALQKFLATANLRNYTPINLKDTLSWPKMVYRRLREEDSTLTANATPDSLTVAAAIKKYQKRRKQKLDGKLTPDLVKRLNTTDKEKFIRIAITLDRYKILPKLPEQYVWVNIPSYYLHVHDSDSVALSSRVVVGKPETRTPIITSAIENMITYPKWTIPESIIKKEILPGLKRDPGYTRKKGFSLVDDEGNEIDPYKVNWSKYKEVIPYRVVQGSGDDNALGVLKFNFANKYSVYLHDTNQRYLFGKSARALSHGCVRVQAWNELAQYLLRNDSLKSANAVKIDSLSSWLATKQKKYIPVRKPMPLYIRYFTCEVKEGKLVFYDDIYGEDKRIREKYFATK
jgi:L,D-transpeptidase YcbB